MNFKEILQNSELTAEDLIGQITEQINAAQKELDEEAAAQDKIEDVRIALIESLIDYFIAIDLIEEEPDKDEVFALLEFLHTFERDVKKHKDVLKRLQDYLED